MEKVRLIISIRLDVTLPNLTFLHIPPTFINVWRFINTLATGIAVVIYKMDSCTPVFVTAPVIVTEIRKPAFKTLYTLNYGLIIENGIRLFHKTCS